MKLVFEFSGRRRQLLSRDAGFSFLLLNIYNPVSFQPTSQFTFYSYTTDGYAIWQVTSNGPYVQNTVKANMTSASIKPSNYVAGNKATMTFQVLPTNYEQGMSMDIALPADVKLYGTTIQTCKAVATAVVSSSILCNYNSGTNSIQIMNAFTLMTAAQYN